MAEEKKETTKKSAPKKKVEVEEVKVEKRFCTKCGKELAEGEECSCSSNEQTNTNTINGDVIVNTCKDIWNTIINTFKKPLSTIKEEVASKDTNKSIILVIVLAISFALYLMAIMSNVESGLSDATFGLSSSVIGINYFKVFIYGILIYASMAIIPIVSTLIVAKITRNNDYSFKKSFKLYIISNSPLVLAYLGMAIIYLINVTLLNVLGLIAFLIISIACFFNFIIGFIKETNIREDRQSYALTSIVVLNIVIAIAAILIVGGSVLGDTYDAITDQNNYNDRFDW